MRTNYSGDKRRRELAAKQKKEAKAAKLAERKALKAQYPEGLPPEHDRQTDTEGELDPENAN